MKNCKKYLAELIGTAVLVLIACGTVTMTMGVGGAGIIIAGLAFGLSVVAMAYAIGHISGAHLNPAVSLGALINKRISVKDFFFYILFQTIGAIIGAGLIFLMIKLQQGFDFDISNMAQTGYAYAAGGVAEQIILSLLVEIVLTFIFVFVVLSVTRKDSEHAKIAGLVIGLTLTIVIMAGAMLTGPSVNPARSIGTNIFVAFADIDALKELWVSIVGPLVGAVLAAFVAKGLLKNKQTADTTTKEEKKEVIEKPVASNKTVAKAKK